MEHGVPATYFDGISSRPFAVTVSLDERSDGLLLLGIGDGRIVWPAKELEIHRSGSVATICLESDKSKSVHIEQSAFIDAVLRYRSRKGYTGIYSRLLSSGVWVHLGLTALIIGLILLAYFLLVPFIAEKSVALLPVSYDSSLGKMISDNVLETESVDTAKTRIVRDFASGIDFGAGPPLVFTVLKSKEENAYALPDGHIMIYSGILKIISDESELAALMSHEAAHVRERHTLKLLTRNLAGYLLVSVAISDVNGIMAVLADNANTLRSLSFSRTFEAEADLHGLETLRRNAIDPNGMSRLFHALKEHHDNSLPAFLSTHPLSGERIRYIEEQNSADTRVYPVHADLKSLFKKLQEGH